MGNSDKILIVEDDHDIREGLLEFLELEGYEVVAATQGKEALELLDRMHGDARPAMILLDLMMPTMDGSRFREEQLRRPEVAGIPVVVMSADNAVAARSESIGVASHLRKPIDLDELLGEIRRLCG